MQAHESGPVSAAESAFIATQDRSRDVSANYFRPEDTDTESESGGGLSPVTKNSDHFEGSASKQDDLVSYSFASKSLATREDKADKNQLFESNKTDAGADDNVITGSNTNFENVDLLSENDSALDTDVMSEFDANNYAKQQSARTSALFEDDIQSLAPSNTNQAATGEPVLTADFETSLSFLKKPESFHNFAKTSLDDFVNPAASVDVHRKPIPEPSACADDNGFEHDVRSTRTDGPSENGHWSARTDDSSEPGQWSTLDSGKTSSSVAEQVEPNAAALVDAAAASRPTTTAPDDVSDDNVTDVTLTSIAASDDYEPSKQQRALYTDSDVARKYSAYQRQHDVTSAASENSVKSKFIAEMMSRAQNKSYHADVTTSLINSRATRASKHPRGIELSKTFTKTPAKTFEAWAARGDTTTTKTGAARFTDEYTRGDLGDFNIASKSPALNAPTHAWTMHGPDKHLHGDGPVEDERQAAAASAPRHVKPLHRSPLSPGVVDEDYYQSLLRTTALASPSRTPLSTTRPGSSAHAQSKPRPASAIAHTKPRQATAHAPSTKSRPSSAKAYTSSTAADDGNGGFTVIGQKQVTRSRRAKSAYPRYTTSHQPSYVDETLFGPPPTDTDVPSPFESRDAQRRPKPLPFVAIAGIEPSRRPPGDDAHAAKQRRNTKAKPKAKHVTSYVDETLFGDGFDEPTFKAPWDTGKTVTPHVFDGTHPRTASAANASKAKRAMVSAGKSKPVWR